MLFKSCLQPAKGKDLRGLACNKYLIPGLAYTGFAANTQLYLLNEADQFHYHNI